ncbi:hypothetical protein HN903_02135 [archaeon]|nr:hypothetical protein [archaeon]MBT7128531.1 hypothetical protein [archaeon]
MKILTFGNPLLKQDSLPLKILPTLIKQFPNITFLHIDPTEDLEQYGPHLTILDTVQNIDKITILTSIEQLHANKVYSMHDFDLALNLKLLRKLDKIKSVKIIGIPMNTTEEILPQLQSILKKCAAQDMQGS